MRAVGTCAHPEGAFLLSPICPKLRGAQPIEGAVREGEVHFEDRAGREFSH